MNGKNRVVQRASITLWLFGKKTLRFEYKIRISLLLNVTSDNLRYVAKQISSAPTSYKKFPCFFTAQDTIFFLNFVFLKKARLI
jgi:hypothetical protein